MVAGDYSEIVALGFPRKTFVTDKVRAAGLADELHWVQLTNVAPAQVRGNTFEIDGVEVQLTCLRYGAMPVAMWHSHRDLVVPSDTDLETFPDWLVSVAVIYHIPTESTVAYTGNGVIPLDTDGGPASLTTTSNEG